MRMSVFILTMFKRGIQCFDEVKSIVVHKYIYLKSYLLRCSIILGCLLLVFGVIIFLSLILYSVPYLKCFHCLVGFSSCTLLLWALMLLFVVELYISSLDPNRFDVTLESFLFGMSWSYVVPQLCFAPERLVTQIARGFNFCVDITIVVIEKGFT